MSAEWMREVDAEVNRNFPIKPLVLTLIVCSDATNVATWSDRQVHPFYLSCGNDPPEVRNAPAGKQVVGYLEKLPSMYSGVCVVLVLINGADTQDKARKKRSLFNTYVWQQAAAILLQQLVTLQHAGMLVVIWCTLFAV